MNPAGGLRRDIRNTAPFQEAERIFREVYQPGEEFISDMADIQLSLDPSHLLFTGTSVEELNQPAGTRICQIDLDGGSIECLTFGPNSDRHARLSPDGTTIAFLSDRDRTSDFQLFFLDPRTQTVTAGPDVDGWVEYFEWASDSRRILLGVAAHGAELSSGQGAYKTDEILGEILDDTPSWMPHVIGLSSDSSWRKAWILEIDTGELSCVSSGSGNIWEATWCGADLIAVVASNGPEEGAWYGAQLSTIDVATDATTLLYAPASQVALPRSSPSANHLAFIEAISSERGYVAGNLRLCDLQDGTCRLLDTDNVDATCIEWISDNDILVAGHRGLETVVLRIYAATGAIKELWRDTVVTTSGKYATVLGLEHPDDFAFVCESFFQRPQVATVRGGSIRIADTCIQNSDFSDDGHAESVTWHAPDGLQIEGWVLRPKCAPPHATILEVHGGPVLHWRPYWLGRAASILMLLRRGYAIFLPNPRGSSGRGQAFAEQVVGDVGGADTTDYLSGIDHLVDLGIADPTRLGISGLSYGGFMSCWLTTQDTRFKAAISVGPATNHVSHHLSCNIPQFVSLFLQDDYRNLAGAYYSRSPILTAHQSKTPTLLVCGELDRCTPAGEAIQFHNALLENGVESIVLTYPEEGHGISGIPAAIDFAARYVTWFDAYLNQAEVEINKKADTI